LNRWINTKALNGFEMVSITGSLAWKNRQSSIHIHGVASGGRFQAYSGRMLEFEVTTRPMKITVIAHQCRL